LRIPIGADMEQIFCEGLRFVLRGAENNLCGSGKVVLGDARNFPEVVKGQFDLVITSPPYANRMSYIRELRPYWHTCDCALDSSETKDSSKYVIPILEASEHTY